RESWLAPGEPDAFLWCDLAGGGGDCERSGGLLVPAGRQGGGQGQGHGRESLRTAVSQPRGERGTARGSRTASCRAGGLFRPALGQRQPAVCAAAGAASAHSAVRNLSRQDCPAAWRNAAGRLGRRLAAHREIAAFRQQIPGPVKPCISWSAALYIGVKIYLT